MKRKSLLLLCAALAGLGSCSSEAPEAEKDPERATQGRPRPLTEDEQADEAPPDIAKLIFLVTVDKRLYSFNPRTPGLAAYHEIGKLDCKGGGNPQSMAIDRSGVAWVFYDTRQLYRVNTANASCESTKYTHPSYHYQLGMGFTSTGPKSQTEQLFIMSPHFGLGTIAFPSLEVGKTGYFAGSAAELTGGGDGRLFMFQSAGADLSEVDRTTYALRPLHKFDKLGHVAAWAFARFGGKFYLFTSSSGLNPSKTTVYDPQRNTETVRDPDIGFVVVGAGQSTLVPPSDASADIAGEAPPPVEPNPGAPPNPPPGGAAPAVPQTPPAPQPRPPSETPPTPPGLPRML